MGSVYSTPEYLGSLCEATDATYRILAVEKGQEILGGVALYERRSRWGAFVSDRLLLYYNGLVLRDYDTKYPSVRTSKQLEAATILEEAISKCGFGSVRLKSRGAFTDPRAFLERGWSAAPAFSYVVSIEDTKKQWERVEQNLRRLVDRCSDQGMVFSDGEDFDGFFELHARTSARKTAPIYLPKERFRRYFTSLKAKNLCRLFQARTADGRLAAAQLVLLGSHPVTHTVSAAADPELQRLGANAFLRWRSFEALSALGYKANDLTDATLNPVTHFKSQLGGTLETAWVLQSRQTPTFRLGARIQSAMGRLR